MVNHFTRYIAVILLPVLMKFYDNSIEIFTLFSFNEVQRTMIRKAFFNHFQVQIQRKKKNMLGENDRITSISLIYCRNCFNYSRGHCNEMTAEKIQEGLCRIII